jgi:hypothetical protein
MARLAASVLRFTTLTSAGKKTTADPMAVLKPDMHTSPKAAGTLADDATMVDVPSVAFSLFAALSGDDNGERCNGCHCDLKAEILLGLSSRSYDGDIVAK